MSRLVVAFVALLLALSASPAAASALPDGGGVLKDERFTELGPIVEAAGAAGLRTFDGIAVVEERIDRTGEVLDTYRIRIDVAACTVADANQIIAEQVAGVDELRNEYTAVIDGLDERDRKRLESEADARSGTSAMIRKVASSDWVCPVDGEMEFRDSWGEPRSNGRKHDGVDIVVASGTKALAGQDRDLWGYVASNNTEALNQVMDLQAMRGGILDWRRAEALLKKLPGTEATYERRCAGAVKVAKLLTEHPKVSEVFHPSLADHVDNTTIASHYRLPGSLLSFRLKDADENTTRRFCDVLATCVILRYALSFDGLATKLNHHATVSEYFTPAEELSRLGIDRLVRIGVGLEDADDLIACLNWALWNHEQVKDEELDNWRESRSRNLGIYPEAKDD